MLDDDGSVKALDKLTGHKLWETKVGTLAAASPALGVEQGLAVRADPVRTGREPSPGNGSSWRCR